MVFAKVNIKEMGVIILMSLVFVTILSSFLGQYSNIPVIKTGGPFILIIISVFLVFLMVAARDGKIDRKEIITIIAVAIALAGSIYALKNYFPEIFSILPQATKEVFSAF